MVTGPLALSVMGLIAGMISLAHLFVLSPIRLAKEGKTEALQTAQTAWSFFLTAGIYFAAALVSPIVNLVDVIHALPCTGPAEEPSIKTAPYF